MPPFARLSDEGVIKLCPAVAWVGLFPITPVLVRAHLLSRGVSRLRCQRDHLP